MMDVSFHQRNVKLIIILGFQQGELNGKKMELDCENKWLITFDLLMKIVWHDWMFGIEICYKSVL
jgi:hypothetical protein